MANGLSIGNGLLETREDGGELEIDDAKASVGLAVGDVASVWIVMTHSELFQLGEDFNSSRVIQMFNASPAVRRDDLGSGRHSFEQTWDERAVPALQETKDLHFVLKALLRVGAVVGLNDPAIEGEVYGCPKRIFYFQHEVYQFDQSMIGGLGFIHAVQNSTALIALPLPEEYFGQTFGNSAPRRIKARMGPDDE